MRQIDALQELRESFGVRAFRQLLHGSVLALLVLLLPAAARADVGDEVHRLLMSEQFAQADALAQRALDEVQAEDDAALARRLEALYLLIDCASYQNRYGDAATGAWIDQATAIATRLYGAESRRLARPTALAANRALTIAHSEAERAAGRAQLARAVELAEHGRGAIGVDDASLVHYSAAAETLQSKDYAAGIRAAEQAERELHDAHKPWQQRRQSYVLGLRGLLRSDLGNGSAALADAHAGAQLAQRVSGADSVHYADALVYLGQAQMNGGDNAGMKDSMEVAVAIYRVHSWVGAQRIDRVKQSLAFAYRQLGDFAHARPLLEEIIAQNPPDAQGHVEWVLPRAVSSLGGIEFESGNVARARELYGQALDLFTRLYGKSNSLYLEQPLIHLGKVAIRQGDLAAAQDYVQRAAAIDATDSSGFRTNEVAELQANLALAQGDAAAAERQFAQAVEHLRRRYGDQHQSTIELLCGGAVAQARRGNDDAAFELAEAAERLRIGLLRGVIPALSESQALGLKTELSTCGGVLLELAARGKDERRLRRAWQLVAESRGLATRLLTARIGAARQSADDAGKRRWSQWQDAARAYAHALLANAPLQELAAARRALDKAEAELGKATLAAVGLQPAEALDALLAQAPGDSVVAYVVTPHFDLRADAHGALFAMAAPAEGELFAMCDTHGASRLLSLGDSAAIDAKIVQWVGLLRDPASDPHRLAEAGRAVRAAIWDPLRLGPVPARVFVVPDGGVFRVNPAALPDGDGYLVERGWRFHLLDSEHDLALAAAPAASHRLLLVGAPDFGPPPAADTHEGGICATGFGPLAGSESEVAGVARLWRDAFRSQPTLLVGPAVTKHSLISAAGRSSVIHFATHAFDAGAPQLRCAPAYASRGVGLSPLRRTSDAAPPAAALALAQANTFFASGAPDGILTETEVTTLPLGGTQWVVLAACDTGLGKVVADEGVFGLRRSFRLAGARTVVMSLWEVEDAATTELMQALYAARWARHADTVTALADAELATLAARRRRGESMHPFYWAGFVASGAWQ